MNIVRRIAKHVRIDLQNLGIPQVSSPPFIILFINSVCNMKCEHCFYWQQLNQPDDLTFEELTTLSTDLGRIQNLNLSGGEPFLRKQFSAICRQFIRHNHVEEIYVPTNGYYTERTVAQIRDVFKEPSLRLFAVELSLDGMPEFHDTFRVTKNSFKKAMETYDALAALQAEDSRLQIHSISTATDTNMDEIRRLTTYLFERCPKMTHHNLALIRGDRKDPTLRGPALREYEKLYHYLQRLWAPRERNRYGKSVEPMLQWAKVQTAQEQQQVIPCRAGVLSAVIHANGDVAVCEQHKPLDNLRHKSFNDIWHSEEARTLRASIKAKECYCTNEIFMWPSITYQPLQLARAMARSKPWRNPKPLPKEERADWRRRTNVNDPSIALPILRDA